MFKKLSGIILSFALVVSLCQITADTKVYAAEDVSSTQYYVGETAAEKYWSQFASWYYYEMLNVKQKDLYMELYNQCMDYLTGNKDVNKDYQASTWANLPEIDDRGLTKDESFITMLLFYNNNPQFWFLSPSISHFVVTTTVGDVTINETTVALGCYNEGEHGATRAKYTAQIKQKVDGWLKEIKDENTYEGRLRKCLQIVMDNVEYASEDSDDSEMVEKHQTVFTAITTGKTVCAGYSELFSMLCNGVGIDCITVTSIGHEWCQVRYRNNWYNIDPTWEDESYNATGGSKWFLKNDTDFLQLNGPGTRAENHVPEERYSKIRPICRYNWGDTPDYEYTEVFRLFNRKDGRRLNTVSPEERDSALLDPNWNLENSPGYSGVNENTGNPVYSLIHLQSGKQLYTADKVECATLTKTGAWVYGNEGAPVFYSVEYGGEPVFRLFNKRAKDQSKAHLYTSDFVEISYLLKNGWVYDNNAKPVFRFINKSEL